MTGRVLLGGTWNMERDRPATMAAHSALSLMRSKGLAFLCIQECSHYLEALRAQAGDEFDVIAFTMDPGRAESAIIVRADVEHGPGHQARATRAGWITVRGGTTPPKYLTTVKLDGWLRIVCGHTAPSVTWPGGRIAGPVRRVISMIQFARAVVRFAEAHKGALLIAGDWNATPAARGRYTPHWIGRKTGMRIAAPVKGTHGSRVIDYALIRDCAARATREKRRGSDHHAVIFKVTS
jgi:hypothetical protein